LRAERPCTARRAEGDLEGLGPAARRRRRRAHARTLAPAAAGRAHRGAARPAGGRVRRRAVAERRAAPAAAGASRAALSAGAPRRNPARCGALPLLAGFAALRIPGRARPRVAYADELA